MTLNLLMRKLLRLILLLSFGLTPLSALYAAEIMPAKSLYPEELDNRLFSIFFSVKKDAVNPIPVTAISPAETRLIKIRIPAGVSYASMQAESNRWQAGVDADGERLQVSFNTFAYNPGNVSSKQLMPASGGLNVTLYGGHTASPAQRENYVYLALHNPFGASHDFTFVSLSLSFLVSDVERYQAWRAGVPLAVGDRHSKPGLYYVPGNTLYIRNSYSEGAADSIINFSSASLGLQITVADWNGDGQSGVGFYDSLQGRFFIKEYDNGALSESDFQYGLPSSDWSTVQYAVSGDWNGDGYASVGLYDPVTGTFHLKLHLSENSPEIVFSFGPADKAGWIPISGDWDGDGADGLGFYDPLGGIFYLKNLLNSADEMIRFPVKIGQVDCQPLAGDWNNDGVDGLGLYCPRQARFHLNNDFDGDTADISLHLGPENSLGWVAVTGVWKTP